MVIFFNENLWWIVAKSMIDSCCIIRCFHKSAFTRCSRLRLSAPLQSRWLIARRQTSYVWEIILYFSRKQITCEKNHHFLRSFLVQFVLHCDAAFFLLDYTSMSVNVGFGTVSAKYYAIQLWPVCQTQSRMFRCVVYFWFMSYSSVT